MVTVEKRVPELGVGPSRLGSNPGRDTCATGERYMTRARTGNDMRLAEFKNMNRVTVMPVVNVDGEDGPCLFVFKGMSLPDRKVLRAGRVSVETWAQFLPRNAVTSTRAEFGGVDGYNFFEWAKEFVEYVKPDTDHGRKVLLTYDGYRSLMILRALENFEQNGVCVYALPAHSSGKTQPLDVVLFSLFKKHLQDTIEMAACLEKVSMFDGFAYCAMLRTAYLLTFAYKNIRASSARSGIWPVDPSCLLGVPRMRSAKKCNEVLTVDELERLFKTKREAARVAILGADTKLQLSRLVDTRNCMVLTSARAMELARWKAGVEKEKREKKIMRALEKALATARKNKTPRKERAKLSDWVWARRARMASMPMEEFQRSVRSMSERIAAAKLRAAAHRQAAGMHLIF